MLDIIHLSYYKIQFNTLIIFQETLQKYALSCGEEGCKHLVLGFSLGSICGCLNSAWLQQYTGDLGLENMICIGYPWSCTICMEARDSLSEHCGLTAERHLEETLVWLTDLLTDSCDGNIAISDLEVCDKAFVFTQLSNPHG